MLDFSNCICQTLHREHLANIALLQRFERLIAAQHLAAAANADSAVRQLLSELASGLADEVERHFAFEERDLFPYIEAMGNSAIAAHLTEEHSAIRPLVIRLAAMAREASQRGFDDTSWDEFRRVGGELCNCMLPHIEKEEMTLLPLIEESMEAETETRLYQDYLESA